MKNKLVIGVIMFALLPFIAKAAPDIAFYLFIAVFAVIMVLVFRRNKGRTLTGQNHLANGFHADESKRRRIINAVRAVRKNRMTLAQASAEYGVSEREIKTVHYLDYLLTY